LFDCFLTDQLLLVDSDTRKKENLFVYFNTFYGLIYSPTLFCVYESFVVYSNVCSFFVPSIIGITVLVCLTWAMDKKIGLTVLLRLFSVCFTCWWLFCCAMLRKSLTTRLPGVDVIFHFIILFFGMLWITLCFGTDFGDSTDLLALYLKGGSLYILMSSLLFWIILTILKL
jgi:hypothetical protein